MSQFIQPAQRVFPMQPANGNDATPPDGVPYARVLWVGAAGTVVVKNGSGDSTTITCVAGQKLDVEATAVGAASTATGIAGGYWGG